MQLEAGVGGTKGEVSKPHSGAPGILSTQQLSILCFIKYLENAYLVPLMC